MLITSLQKTPSNKVAAQNKSSNNTGQSICCSKQTTLNSQSPAQNGKKSNPNVGVYYQEKKKQEKLNTNSGIRKSTFPQNNKLTDMAKEESSKTNTYQKQHSIKDENYSYIVQGSNSASILNNYSSYEQCQKYYLPGGLPNIGNTCHINSIIQFLFGATEFRSYIIQLSKTVTKLTDTIKIIGQLFTLLLNKDVTSNNETLEKKRLLQSFVYNLEQINLTYIRYSQEDAFETLNNILNNLNYTFSQKERIRAMFALEYSIRCRQCIDSETQLQSLFPSLDEKCQRCGQTFIKTYKETPQYLILTQQQLKQQFTFQSDTYRFVSCIIYSGSGYYGHYKCLRRQNTLYYELDDCFTKQIRPSELSSYFSNYGKSQQGYAYYSKKTIIATLYVKTNKQDLLREQQEQKKKEKQSMEQQSLRQKKRLKQDFEKWYQKEVNYYSNYHNYYYNYYYKGSNRMNWMKNSKDLIFQEWPQVIKKNPHATMQWFFKKYQVAE